MGARGRLKLINESTASPDVVGTAAAQAKPVAPNKPEDLAPEISALWDEIIVPLEEAGLIGGMDFPTLVLALEHYAMARRAADHVRENGLTTYDEKNHREARNPSVMVFNSATESFIKLSAQLGLSFVSRARVAVPEQGNSGADNPFMP
jgi:P27 family predicted phage terminase small subunit